MKVNSMNIVVAGNCNHIHQMRALIHSIYDVEIAGGKLPAIKCSKRRVARNRMTARHLGKRLDGIKDAPCETGCTNWITIRKSNHIRYFGNITLRRLCDSYGVTHTQALAGAYLESTRARTSATVAQRPASISEMPRIALTASSTSCGERCGCSGVMLPDMDDSTIMPQIIPQIAPLLFKINVPHCLVIKFLLYHLLVNGLFWHVI